MQSPVEGSLIRLRAREPEDAPLLYRWFNDPEVTEHLAMRYPLSMKSEREFIERVSSPGYAHAGFAIETIADHRLIGGVDLLNASPENRSASLGIAIGDKTCWDGGCGTDTMRTVCRFGFEMMNLHRIELTVDATNARARHVYRKVGFVEEGVLRDHRFIAGAYRDTVVMSILRNELQEEPL